MEGTISTPGQPRQNGQNKQDRQPENSLYRMIAEKSRLCAEALKYSCQPFAFPAGFRHDKKLHKKKAKEK